MNKYYVYEWFCVETDIVFYVGKGKGRRYKAKSNVDRSKHFINKIKLFEKQGLHVSSRIIKNNLSEEDALQSEKEIIALYKEKGIRLINKTNGGEGLSGYRHTEEAKRKMQILHSPENCKGNSKLTIENVINIKNDLLLDQKSIRQIAKEYNVRTSAIHQIKKGDSWININKDMNNKIITNEIVEKEKNNNLRELVFKAKELYGSSKVFFANKLNITSAMFTLWLQGKRNLKLSQLNNLEIILEKFNLIH